MKESNFLKEKSWHLRPQIQTIGFDGDNINLAVELCLLREAFKKKCQTFFLMASLKGDF